jgi:hypothetical protein
MNVCSPLPERKAKMLNKILTTTFALTATIITLMSANMTKAQVAQDGLVSYWSFDEADISGDTVEDVWGENDGTIMGDPGIVTGKVGEAFEFDGIDDYISIPVSPSLNMGGSSYTIVAWALVDSSVTYASERILVEYGAWAAGTYQLTSMNDNHWKTNFHGRSSNQGSECNIDWTDSEWHHLVGVFDNDANFMRTYFDGTICDTTAENNAPVDVDLPLYIASRGGGSLFSRATIDEVAIYNRAISEDEVKQNFAAEGLVAVSPADRLTETWGRIKVSR